MLESGEIDGAARARMFARWWNLECSELSPRSLGERGWPACLALLIPRKTCRTGESRAVRAVVKGHALQRRMDRIGDPWGFTTTGTRSAAGSHPDGTQVAKMK